MPCPGVGPCSVYDLDLSCLAPSGMLPDPCLTDGTPVSQTLIDSAVLAASQLAWAVTGRQFGCCTVTLRPCRKGCDDACCGDREFGSFGSGSGYPWLPYKQLDGTWTNIACPCDDECSCTTLCEIRLPSPVCSVDEVKIDGLVIDPATYRVDNFQRLVRVGEECWPTCNDLRFPDTEEGTWSVTFTYGKPVPELVKLAAAEFAGELIKGCVNRPCRLPRNVVAVTRQGVSEVFTDPTQAILQGLTGLYMMDVAIRAYNPKRLMQKAAVFSVDQRKGGVRTTWVDGDDTGPGCT